MRNNRHSSFAHARSRPGLCWSCRTGVCHTCTTPLLSGEVTYSPAPLESPADGQVLICCARPDTDLVLDM